jgi:hypothetical protein
MEAGKDQRRLWRRLPARNPSGGVEKAGEQGAQRRRGLPGREDRRRLGMGDAETKGPGDEPSHDTMKEYEYSLYCCED